MANPPPCALDPAWCQTIISSIYDACDVSLGKVKGSADAALVVRHLEQIVVGIKKAASLYPKQSECMQIKHDVLAVEVKVAQLAYRAYLLHEKTKDIVPAYLQHCKEEYASAVEGITGVCVKLDDHPVTIGFKPMLPGAHEAEEKNALPALCSLAGEQSSSAPTLNSATPTHEDKDERTHTHTRDIRDLCHMFAEDTTGTSLVMVFANAGTGKTWLCRQAMRALSLRGSTRCVPLLVSLQDVVRLKLDFNDVLPRPTPNSATPTHKDEDEDECTDPLEQYIRTACSTKWADCLVAAYRAQNLVVILDGLDEVPGIRDDLVSYIIRQSGRKLRQCLLTSRPEFIPASLTAHMRAQHSLTSMYDLLPLSWNQQQNIIRLLIPDTGEDSAGHFMDQLLKYMRARTEFDRLACRLDPAGLRVLEGSQHADFDNTRSKRFVQTTRMSSPACDGLDLSADAAITTTTSTVLVRPVETCDELLEEARGCMGAITEIMRGIANSVGLATVESIEALDLLPGAAGLVVAPLKNTERIRIKAKNYAKLSQKTGIPDMAWIMDVVRFTASCTTVKQMLAFLAHLTSVDAGVMEVIRMKNLFATLENAHFRRLAVVIKFHLGQGHCHLFEVQIHHACIFSFNNANKSICRHPYEYFRKKFQGGVLKSALGDKTNGWLRLDGTLAKWSAFLQTPVLLSMFVVVLSRVDFGKSGDGQKQLPNTKLELYAAAVSAMVSKTASAASTSDTFQAILFQATQRHRVAGAPVGHEGAQVLEDLLMRMLEVVAFHNQTDAGTRKRVFTSKDVQQSLSSNYKQAKIQQAALQKAVTTKLQKLEANIHHGLCARALFTYQAVHSDEVSFNPGVIIEDVEQIDEDWWRGTVRDARGLFPRNHVDLIDLSAVRSEKKRELLLLDDVTQDLMLKAQECEQLEQEYARLHTLFQWLVAEGSGTNCIPTLKTLERRGDGTVTLQATHLSFQEYLCARHMEKHPEVIETAIGGPAAFIRFTTRQNNLTTLLPPGFVTSRVTEFVQSTKSRGGINMKDAELLGAALSSNLPLTVLNLDGCGLRDGELAVLGRALSQNQTQVAVCLSNNPGVTDYSALAGAYSLDLSNCKDLVDVSALGEVHSLNLSGCTGVLDVSGLSRVSILNLSGCNNVMEVSNLFGVTELVFQHVGHDEATEKVLGGSALGDGCDAHTTGFQKCGPKRVSGLGALKKLDLTGCSALVTVCDITSIDTMVLDNCSDLKDLRSVGTVRNASLKNCCSLLDVSVLSRCHTVNLSGCHNVVDVVGLAAVIELIAKDCKRLQRVNRLGALMKLDLSGCSALRTVCDITSVETLLLDGCNALDKFRDIGAVKNASLKNCSSLVDVSVLSSCNTVNLFGCKNIIKVSGFGTVTELIMQGCKSLQQVSGMGVLTKLDLAGCAALTTVCDITSIHSLVLDDCGALTNLHHVGAVNNASLKNCSSMLKISWLSSCRTLNLSGSYSTPGRVTDLGFEKLAAARPLLASLNLRHCKQVTDLGVERLADGCPQLVSLILMYCTNVTDMGLRKLAEGCPRLASLDLHGCNKVTDKGLLKLAEGCPLLASVNLTNCYSVTDLGLKKVAEGCPLLASLNITNCISVTDLGLEKIAECCPKLASLDLDGCTKVTDQGLSKLAEGCLIRCSHLAEGSQHLGSRCH